MAADPIHNMFILAFSYLSYRLPTKILYAFLFLPRMLMNLSINTWYRYSVPRITLFLRNTKLYNHLSYTSFKIVPLCKYTLLPATVKVLEIFLVAIL
jgi:hypothetical protein